MRRRGHIGGLTLVLIVAGVAAVTLFRTMPRTPLVRPATPHVTVPATTQRASTPPATPVPAIARAITPLARVTATPTAPTATATPPPPPPTAPVETPAGTLSRDVQAIRARDLPERNSVTVIVLGGEEAHLDDTREVYPASTVKLPIYLTLAHRIRTGEAGFTWETRITVQPADIVGGTGVLQHAPGSTHSVRELAHLMVTESDNVAANILLGRLGGGQDTRRDHLLAGAAVVDDYLTVLGIHGMTLRHGLQDNQAFATGMLSTTTSAALARLLLLTDRGRTTLDGATDLLALLSERGTHNPWHPSDAVACGLAVQRIGGIYPASADRPGVRLDALIVATPGSAVRYILTVAVPTTPALEGGVEAQVARFEGDLQLLLTGHWAQCVDSTTRQFTP